MMTITECLNAEHGVFLTQMDVLESLVQNASPETLKSATRIIISSVEKHRDVEEKLLYPEIQKFAPAPIRVMEFEHREIEKLVSEINNSNDAQTCKTAVRDLIAVLREHIVKEIRVLFPMAERAIPREQLEEMARKCVECYHEEIKKTSPECMKMPS